jgi:uncharacterized protein YllA (UPF0747 family)
VDEALAARLRSHPGRLGFADTAAVDRLLDPATAVFVTGQQPGPWGGPAYTGYKAATAVAAARRHTARTGQAAVALFWLGADDADHDEVGWGTLPRPDLSLFRHRWPAPTDARSWVGDRRLENPPERTEILATWGRTPDAAGTGDLGDAQSRWLLARFGAELVVLDARWPEVRAAGRPLWERYLDRRAEVTTRLRERGAELAGDGSPPIADEAVEQALFLVREGRREAAAAEAALRAAVDAGGEAVAPSVVLRAPLQDFLFAPAAQLVGRGEAAYLAQLDPLGELLDLPGPVARVPRLHLTVLPAGLVDPASLAEAVADPEAWVGERAAARVTDEAEARLREASAAVAESLGSLGGGGGDVGQLAASAARKIDHQIARVREALDRRARRSLYAEQPALRHLSEFLRPRRRPQDRGLSGDGVALLLGEAYPAAVLAAADAHLEQLATGPVSTFALETPA